VHSFLKEATQPSTSQNETATSWHFSCPHSALKLIYKFTMQSIWHSLKLKHSSTCIQHHHLHI